MQLLGQAVMYIFQIVTNNFFFSFIFFIHWRRAYVVSSSYQLFLWSHLHPVKHILLSILTKKEYKPTREYLVCSVKELLVV